MRPDSDHRHEYLQLDSAAFTRIGMHHCLRRCDLASCLRSYAIAPAPALPIISSSRCRLYDGQNPLTRCDFASPNSAIVHSQYLTEMEASDSKPIGSTYSLFAHYQELCRGKQGVPKWPRFLLLSIEPNLAARCFVMPPLLVVTSSSSIQATLPSHPFQ